MGEIFTKITQPFSIVIDFEKISTNATLPTPFIYGNPAIDVLDNTCL